MNIWHVLILLAPWLVLGISVLIFDWIDKRDPRRPSAVYEPVQSVTMDEDMRRAVFAVYKDMGLTIPSGEAKWVTFRKMEQE
jgi:hypothetical protein